MRDNPSCAACHSNLDPLGSFLYGHVGFLLAQFDSYPASINGAPFPGLYAGIFENQWQNTTGQAPAYFGEPGSDLTDLGQMIAADPQLQAPEFGRLRQMVLGRYGHALDLGDVG